MSFTSDVKNELYHIQTNEISSKSELAGLIKFKGFIEIGKTTYLELTLKDSGAMRRAKQLLKNFDVNDTTITYQNQKRLKMGKIFTMRITAENVEDFLKDLGLDLLGHIKDDKFSDPTIFSAFVRGAFIASGSIANPMKYHHLEFYNQQIEPLNWMKKKFEDFFGIVGSTIDIKYGYRFYIKNGEMINEFLNLIEATDSANFFSSIMASKKIHSDVTRSMNFIDANSKRSGNASWKQIEAVKIVENALGLDDFPAQVRETAILRMKNPELSLREIGNILDPPVSKSVVHRRIMKIIEVAKKIQEGG